MIVHARDKDDIGAQALEHSQVLLQRARVFAKILTDAELRGVHKDAGPDMVAFLPRPLYKRSVAHMQRTHGRDQSEAPVHRRAHGSQF